jgi:channel protein (hemolysin III family)
MEEHNKLIEEEMIQMNNTIVVENNIDHVNVLKQDINKPYINNKPEIISLDKISKYNNLFISVHPFVLTGYRINYSIKNCFHSIFKWHNETLNIWTHLISFIIFIILLIYYIIDNTNINNNKGMIYIFIISSCLLFIFSSLYHILSCHSLSICSCCYKLDLFGILLELITATTCSIYYMFHEYDNLRKIYIIFFLILGISTMIITINDLFISAKFNIFIIFLFSSLFIISFLSGLHWVLIADINEISIITKYILSGFMCLFIGFLFFLSKFPECIIQNTYIDLFFQSHIIWHLCCFGSTISYLLMIVNYNQIIENKIRQYN